MNGKIIKKLRQVSHTIPAIDQQRLQTIKKTGEELIKEGILEDGEGIQIGANAMYASKVFVPGFVDHYQNLKSVYIKEGLEGVHKYADRMITLAATKERENNNAI